MADNYLLIAGGAEVEELPYFKVLRALSQNFVGKK